MKTLAQRICEAAGHKYVTDARCCHWCGGCLDGKEIVRRSMDRFAGILTGNRSRP